MTISKLFFAAVAVAGMAWAEDQITVAVDGAPGPVAGACLVQSWAFGVAAGPTPGSGNGTGRPQITALALTRLLDECSPKLFSFATDGHHIAKVVLTQTAVGGVVPRKIMTVTLYDAIVSNYQIGGTATTPLPAESVALGFAKIEFEYFPLKADGTTGPGITVRYDLTTGKEY